MFPGADQRGKLAGSLGRGTAVGRHFITVSLNLYSSSSTDMYATFDDDVQYSEKALVKSASLILSHFKNTHLHQWTMVKTFAK